MAHSVSQRGGGRLGHLALNWVGVGETECLLSDGPQKLDPSPGVPLSKYSQVTPKHSDPAGPPKQPAVLSGHQCWSAHCPKHETFCVRRPLCQPESGPEQVKAVAGKPHALTTWEGHCLMLSFSTDRLITILWIKLRITCAAPDARASFIHCPLPLL